MITPKKRRGSECWQRLPPMPADAGSRLPPGLLRREPSGGYPRCRRRTWWVSQNVWGEARSISGGPRSRRLPSARGQLRGAARVRLKAFARAWVNQERAGCQAYSAKGGYSKWRSYRSDAPQGRAGTHDLPGMAPRDGTQSGSARHQATWLHYGAPRRDPGAGGYRRKCGLVRGAQRWGRLTRWRHHPARWSSKRWGQREPAMPRDPPMRLARPGAPAETRRDWPEA